MNSWHTGRFTASLVEWTLQCVKTASGIKRGLNALIMGEEALEDTTLDDWEKDKWIKMGGESASWWEPVLGGSLTRFLSCWIRLRNVAIFTKPQIAYSLPILVYIWSNRDLFGNRLFFLIKALFHFSWGMCSLLFVRRKGEHPSPKNENFSSFRITEHLEAHIIFVQFMNPKEPQLVPLSRVQLSNNNM